MNVYGFAVSQEQIDAGNKRMETLPFTASEIEQVLIQAGVPEKIGDAAYNMKYVANRVADRLI
ncbi:hypothetical protein ACYPKM_02295 [Pseudomonas aeruginosa]